ncbi:MAG: AraC family transcriptional regulator [Spirochaetaceae bacterium]|jgi:AraC-like DNA-binding protein|nr:AraC family transcriptional regulator [Spirochaetaceae bacterium]
MSVRFHKHKLENLIVIPKIVTIHYLEIDESFSYVGERHDFWEIVYADKDDVQCRAEDRWFTLPEGNILFHKPGEYHSLSACPGTLPNVFIITFECTSEAMRFFEKKTLKFPARLKMYVHDILKEARLTFAMNRQSPFITKMELSTSPVLGGQQLIRLNLEQLLIHLLRAENDKTPQKNIFVSKIEFENELTNRIIAILKQNLYGHITVQALCRNLNYSKSYLYDLFKENTGTGIKDFYIKLKIEEAKRLLRKRTLSIMEISEQLGFNTVSYFCSVFKKLTLMTPTQYVGTVSY